MHCKMLANSAYVQACYFNSVQGSANTEMQLKAKQCKNEPTNELRINFKIKCYNASLELIDQQIQKSKQSTF